MVFLNQEPALGLSSLITEPKRYCQRARLGTEAVDREKGSLSGQPLDHRSIRKIPFPKTGSRVMDYAVVGGPSWGGQLPWEFL